MTLALEEIAQAFSGHRFADAYPYLADDVHWILVGGPVITGMQAVVDTCEETLRELAQTTTHFAKFKTIVGPDAVVIDATGTYDAPDGSRSTVASCDIFVFVGGSIAEITSYTIELPAD
jgi:ketosteroid isomerase-like protein